MRKLIGIFFLFITGCQTPYVPHGSLGGYSEIALGDARYKVQFSGNAFTSETVVYNGMLRRCAEIAQSNGSGYFVIVSLNNQPYYGSITTPGQVTGNTTYNAVGPNMVTANSNYTYTPPTTYTTTKHVYVAEMQIVHPDQQSGGVYSSKSILSSIAK